MTALTNFIFLTTRPFSHTFHPPFKDLNPNRNINHQALSGKANERMAYFSYVSNDANKISQKYSEMNL